MEGLSSNPADELKKLTAPGIARDELRQRMDDDYALFTLEKSMYQIPSEEGDWMTAVINPAATDGNRMIDLLSYAREKLVIEIEQEKKKGREALAATERAAIGLLNLADMVKEDCPEETTVKGTSAAYMVLRGWGAYRIIITQDEDDNDIIPEAAVWDTRNTYWNYGKDRMLWVCYTRYSTNEGIEDEYEGWNDKKHTSYTLASGSAAYTPIYDIWKWVGPDKPVQNGVAINSEWVKEPRDVKVGGKPLLYIPVRIKAGRSLPLVVGGTLSTDNIKHVGESFLVNTRDILPLESRLFSYRMTRARDLAQTANVVEYDGAKSGGNPPSGFEKASTRGRTAYLDSSKGQKLAERMTPPQGNEIDLAAAQAANMRISGSGMGPVAYGMPPYPDTAQGTDIINHNILDAIKPFKLGLEQDRAWMAQEFIRQYKYGNFKERTFEGYDKNGKRFEVKVKPQDINDNWRFKCELVLDLVTDENIHVGMAATEVKTGLLSKQTARDKHNLAPDPDAEQAIIDRERAEEIGELALLRTAKELWDEKDDFSRLQAQQIFIKLMQSQPQPQQGMAGQPGVMPPEATAGGARPRIPTPVREAARQQVGG